jgi:hypothetical protein
VGVSLDLDIDLFEIIPINGIFYSGVNIFINLMYEKKSRALMSVEGCGVVGGLGRMIFKKGVKSVGREESLAVVEKRSKFCRGALQESEC